MTQDQQLAISRFFESGNVDPTAIRLNGTSVTNFAGEALDPNDELYEYSRTGGVASLVKLEPKTAEEHIATSGYTAVRLVTLLDLEARLGAANKTSPKLVAVRQWLDQMTAAYAADQSPKMQWPARPHSFEETFSEAALALS